ncbi:MAG: DUF1836 domain-containing protein [Lachnospiraceae bacterium]|nr:DUF1836 domain-containing protein [Lachnospiraceae bacterium]
MRGKMEVNIQQILDNMMKRVDQLTYIRTEEIPNIELYMDQVLTFMNERLRHTTRNPEEDKILTKTMINNYAKSDLLPPPNRKKYSKDHILLLLFIYYFKGVLSINDTREILGNISEKWFDGKNDYGLEDIYNEVFRMEPGQIELLRKDIYDKFSLAETTFAEAPEDAQEFLRFFSFICLLSFDVYVKRMLIESAIDELCCWKKR